MFVWPIQLTEVAKSAADASLAHRLKALEDRAWRAEPKRFQALLAQSNIVWSADCILEGPVADEFLRSSASPREA